MSSNFTSIATQYPEYKSHLTHSTADACINSMFASDSKKKPGYLLFHFFQKLIGRGDALSDSSVRKLIESAHKVLNSHKLSSAPASQMPSANQHYQSLLTMEATQIAEAARLAEVAKIAEAARAAEIAKAAQVDKIAKAVAPQSFKEQYNAIFERYGCVHAERSGSCWHDFTLGNVDRKAARTVNGYDAAQKQWKVFLNPKKAHFMTVLDRVLKKCKADTISIWGKIINSDTYARHSEIPAIEDACEVKIVIYFSEETSSQSQKKLKAFVEAIEKEFTADEISQFNCNAGSRKKWIAKAGSATEWEKKSTPQFGPSFTKQRSSLIYYSQGGYTESGRDKFVGSTFDKAGLSARFEGKNYYRYKGDTDPFDEPFALNVEDDQENTLQMPKDAEFAAITKERIERWTVVQQQEIQVLMKQIADAKGTKKEKIERQLGLKMQRIGESSTLRLIEKAKVKLNKKFVTDTEVALTCGKSITSYRALKIQEACRNIGKFDDETIAKKLGISSEALQQWLAAAEKEVFLNTLLMQLGSNISVKSILENYSSNELTHFITQISDFLNELKKDPSILSKPLQIVKLYNLKLNLDLATTLKKVTTTAAQVKCEILINQVLEQFSLTRQKDLFSLMQSPLTPKPLRKKIYSTLFGIAKGTEALKLATGIPVSEQIATILNSALETKELLTKITEDNYETCKGKFPEHIRRFFEAQKRNGSSLKKSIKIIEQKLDGVIARAKVRQDIIANGGAIDLPHYFHATNDEKIAFAITFSGIRPASSTYYGAFLSTSPAMVRYGGIIIGLPEQAAFESEIGVNHNFGNPKPIMLPDASLVGFKPNVMADKIREKWIGFQNQVGINPKEKEIKNRLFVAFSHTLKTSYEAFCDANHQKRDLEKFYEFEAKIIKTISERHLMFSFTQDAEDATRGKWQALIEHSSKSKGYIPFTKECLNSIFETDGTNDFALYLTKNIDQFLPQIQNYWTNTWAPKQFLLENGINVQDTRGSPLAAYMISIDDDETLKTYFTNKDFWSFNGSRSKTKTISHITLRDEYKKLIGYDALSKKSLEPDQAALSETEYALQRKAWQESEHVRTQVKAEIDQFLNTHFVPLMEQLIEFDFMTQEGVFVRPSWRG